MFLFYVMASRNFGNVKVAAVKRHPGSNVTGVTNFERGLQLLRTPKRSQTPIPPRSNLFDRAFPGARGAQRARWSLGTLTYVGGLQEPARVQQILDGSRLLPVP